MAVLPQLEKSMEHHNNSEPSWSPKSQSKPRRQRYRTQRRRPNRARADSELSDTSASSTDTASVSSSSDGSSISQGSPVTSSSNPCRRGHHFNNKSNSNRKNHPRRPMQVDVMTEAEQHQYVALDCEMVGVGEYGKQSALARVTLIDWHGAVLMDEYVKQDREVTDYRTFVSGVTADQLEQAQLDFSTCQQRVLELLNGKILVGHGLKNDLRVLGISHPWYMIRDTAKYEPFMKVRFDDGILWPRGLKDLCHEKLHREVQVCGKPHSPYEDALAALDLYRLVRIKWEKAMAYKVNKTRAIEQQMQQQQQLQQPLQVVAGSA